MQRLEPQHESRMVGFTFNPETGLPAPNIKTFIIGHGQQLARKRLAEMLGSHLYTGLAEVTRQQRRAAARKTSQRVMGQRPPEQAFRRGAKYAGERTGFRVERLTGARRRFELDMQSSVAAAQAA